MPLTIDDIHAAARTIEGRVVRTPCSRSLTLSAITGASVHLKFENQQFTASFKDRGAAVKLSGLSTAERRAGVIAMSAGNHAQAVAYQARELGLTAVIVMPRATPSIKVERTQALGAAVVLHGKSLVEARQHAQSLSREHGYTMIHPYDDERVMAGQGTVALEMLEDFPDLEVLLVPVGGGGLLSGMAVAAKALKPDIEVLGVQSDRFPSMAQALRGQEVSCGRSTMAEGIAVKEPGTRTLPLIKSLVDEILLVTEGDIEKAVLLLLEVEKSVSEGAGAAGLAALLADRERFQGRRVGLILSGGNIDLMDLSSIIQRGLVRSGRLVRVLVGIPDVPGTLAELTRIVGQRNANIIEVRHQRAFTNLAMRSTEVEFVLQTLGARHVREILNDLNEAGYEAVLAGTAPLKAAF